MTLRALGRFALICTFGFSLAVSLARCSDTSNYNAGYANGFVQGRAASDSAQRASGYEEGFRAGFAEARPGSLGSVPTGVWKVVSILIAVLGILKIVGSLVLFTVILIVRGRSDLERFAKMLATTLGVIIVFWITNSLTNGFAKTFSDIALSPAGTSPGAKTSAGIIAAGVTYLSFWILEVAAKISRNHDYVETLLVLFSSGLVTILVPLFISLHSVPNINAYRLFDCILGVVIGGLAWVVHRLLLRAQEIQRAAPGKTPAPAA